jgi:hypothetical protein
MKWEAPLPNPSPQGGGTNRLYRTATRERLAVTTIGAEAERQTKPLPLVGRGWEGVLVGPDLPGHSHPTLTLFPVLTLSSAASASRSAIRPSVPVGLIGVPFSIAEMKAAISLA